jgi:hypothetical protein
LENLRRIEREAKAGKKFIKRQSRATVAPRATPRRVRK